VAWAVWVAWAAWECNLIMSFVTLSILNFKIKSSYRLRPALKSRPFFLNI
jgi:hypothetical protein